MMQAEPIAALRGPLSALPWASEQTRVERVYRRSTIGRGCFGKSLHLDNDLQVLSDSVDLDAMGALGD